MVDEKKIEEIVTRAKEKKSTFTSYIVPTDAFRYYRKIFKELNEEEFVEFLLQNEKSLLPLGFVEEATRLNFLCYAIYYKKYFLAALITYLFPELWEKETGSGKKVKDFVQPGEERQFRELRKFYRKIRGGKKK